jgi:hypothetical protein
LREALPERVRVGTVDKFLLSRNRLNVAISRTSRLTLRNANESFAACS